MGASTKTVMAQTRAIIIDRLRTLERMGAGRPFTGGSQSYDKAWSDWQALDDEYSFYTNFLITEAKHGQRFTEDALDEAERDRSIARPRAEEVRGD